MIFLWIKPSLFFFKIIHILKTIIFMHYISSEHSNVYILDFLHDLFLISAQQTEELQRARNRLDIEQIRLYIASHCTEGITLKKVADRFYVSMEYLSKVFKSTYGEGFTEYVTRLRMEKAAALIAEGTLPLKEVGEAVGYYDQAHFYKTFKKIYGKAPGQFRQDLKINNK